MTVAAARAEAIRDSLAANERDLADTAIVFAADSLVAMVVERGQQAVDDCERLVESVARVAHLSNDAAAFGIFLRAIANPSIIVLPPRVAAEVHLNLLVGLAPITDASVWVEELGGRATRIASVGSAAATRRSRNVAAATIAGDHRPDVDDRTQINGIPILRWGRPVGAVVARSRTGDRARASIFMAESAAMLSPVLEREVLLARSILRDQQLHEANERRLVRVGFDLHDGPLQELAALADDLRLARDQLADSLTGRLRTILLGRFDDLEARLTEIDRSLREVSHSLESSSAGVSSLPETLRRELDSFERRAGVEVNVEISGTFDGISASQRIALSRIAQEALSNIREHAGATSVQVTLAEHDDGIRLEIVDDGTGFDVSHTVVAAARRGRLGLVGMNERVRLLGGSFSLQSSVGKGTRVVVNLPSWDPAGTTRAPAVVEVM